MPAEKAFVGMGADVSGTDIILSDLEKMVPTDTEVDEALQAGAEVVAESMKKFAPEKSGAMKKAIKPGNVRWGSKGRTITVGVHRRDIKLKNNEYYPAYVNYGHGGPRPAPPHPFIQPGYDTASDKAYTAIKQTVINQIKEKGL